MGKRNFRASHVLAVCRPLWSELVKVFFSWEINKMRTVTRTPGFGKSALNIDMSSGHGILAASTIHYRRIREKQGKDDTLGATSCQALATLPRGWFARPRGKHLPYTRIRP